MRFCTKCGKQSNDGDRFCFYCGAPLPNAELTAEQTNSTVMQAQQQIQTPEGKKHSEQQVHSPHTKNVKKQVR